MSADQQTEPLEPLSGPTDGPWRYSEDFAEVQTANGDRTLAKMDHSDDWSVFSSETHANGRLMAQAPELASVLAALYATVADVLDLVSDGEPLGERMDDAERLLSRAARVLDAAGVESGDGDAPEA